MLVPERKYIESTNFNPYKNVTYLDKRDFTGRIVYYSLDGQFLEGAVYVNGEATNSVEFVDIPFMPQTGCYGYIYVGQECHEEPLTEIEWVTETESRFEYDSEMGLVEVNEEVLRPVEIVIGTQVICESVYEWGWDKFCGKNHDND